MIYNRKGNMRRVGKVEDGEAAVPGEKEFWPLKNYKT
jgi:hypothetical protein